MMSKLIGSITVKIDEEISSKIYDTFIDYIDYDDMQVILNSYGLIDVMHETIESFYTIKDEGAVIIVLSPKTNHRKIYLVMTTELIRYINETYSIYNASFEDQDRKLVFGDIIEKAFGIDIDDDSYYIDIFPIDDNENEIALIRVYESE